MPRKIKEQPGLIPQMTEIAQPGLNLRHGKELALVFVGHVCVWQIKGAVCSFGEDILVRREGSFICLQTNPLLFMAESTK